MDDALSGEKPRRPGAMVTKCRWLNQELRVGYRRAAYCHRMEALAVIGCQRPESGLAQPHCLVEHRIENRREIARRRVDDCKISSSYGRGLLVERLAKVAQQPRIFHRDDRLGSEILHKHDQLIGERRCILLG